MPSELEHLSFSSGAVLLIGRGRFLEVTGLALIFAFLAFTLSASAGLGGSLILVPAMSLLMGPKQGIATASLLLACNNVAKVIVYRASLPIRAAAVVVLLTIAGAALGAIALVAAPEAWVGAAIIVSVGLSFLSERLDWARIRKASAPVLALCAGAVSGFSGTSGPVKGLALRNLALDRRHFVGAASLVSLAGDVTKTTVFAEGALLGGDTGSIVLYSVPLMVIAALTGRHINSSVGERGYTALFWVVMAGYSLRLMTF